MQPVKRTSPFRMIDRIFRFTLHTVVATLPTILAVSTWVLLAPAGPFPQATAEEAHNAMMALPGEKCRVQPRMGWLSSEKWAWTEICEGRVANFNSLLNETLDPTNRGDDSKWSDDRKLTRDFLRTILLYEPYRSAIPAKGVRIVAAYLPGGIDLVDASIKHPLMLYRSLVRSTNKMHRLKAASYISFDGSRFSGELNMDSASVAGDLFMRDGAEFNEVVLRGATVGGQLSMTGAKFSGKLNMDSASVAGALLMHDGAEFSEVVLRGATVGGQLSMTGAKFSGKLNMDSASVADALLMRNGAEFNEVVLRGATVGGQLSMIGAKFSGKLDMDSASVAGALLMHDGAEFNEVVLRGTTVGDQLSMIGAKFSGILDLNSVTIANSLFARRAKFIETFDLTFSTIGSNLDFRGAAIGELNLTGTKVNGELRLGSDGMVEIDWKRSTQGPKLTLRNTQIRFLQDTEGTWPDYLDREFDGFSYTHFGGLGAGEQEIINSRGREWFLNWLGKDESYSPQPYRQLSSVLRTSGYDSIADDILFEARERERGESNIWQAKWWGLTALRFVIGYGYGVGNFNALGLAAIFVIFGYLVLRTKVKDSELGFWYSVDRLLPFIRLQEWHHEGKMEGWPKWYFYLQAIVGYVLTFFAIAGLSGLAE